MDGYMSAQTTFHSSYRFINDRDPTLIVQSHPVMVPIDLAIILSFGFKVLHSKIGFTIALAPLAV